VQQRVVDIESSSSEEGEARQDTGDESFLYLRQRGATTKTQASTVTEAVKGVVECRVEETESERKGGRRLIGALRLGRPGHEPVICDELRVCGLLTYGSRNTVCAVGSVPNVQACSRPLPAGTKG
jgi:hypothetical protein